MRTILRMTAALSLGLTLSTAAAAADVVVLQQGKAPDKGKKSTLDRERLQKALQSGDEAAVLAALTELGQAAAEDRATAAELVGLVLAQGGSVKVLVQALEVSGKLAQPASSPAVAPYANHRQVEVRRAAVLALSQTGGPQAVEALRSVLRGRDAALRGHAASALGNLKAQEAVPDLFAVLPRGVPEAASAIGELCRGPDCGRFVDLLGKLPLDLMGAGLVPIVLRSDPDVNESTKLEVVGRLRGLQTKAAADLLNAMLSQFPKDGNAKVRAALEAAVKSKPGAKEPS